MTDYISRADAIDALYRSSVYSWSVEQDQSAHTWALNIIAELPSADAEFADLPDIPRAYYERIVGNMSHEINMLKEQLESADAESDDLIIKGAKGIQDGLYNIKDGKLFKYKAKGGTVQTYPIVPSADAVHGEWLYVENEPYSECSKCGRYIDDLDEDKYAYCPYCGAKMKGGGE